MIRFTKTRNWEFGPRALTIPYKGETYYPNMLHSTMGQTRAIGASRTFRPHRHNVYHIVIYTRGRGGFMLRGKVISVKPGTIALVSPGVLHDLVSHRGDTTYSEITFDLMTRDEAVLDISFIDFLRRYSGLPLKIGDWLQLSESDARQMELLMLQLTDYCNSMARHREYFMQLRLARIFDYLISICLKDDIDEFGKESPLAEVRNHLERNFTESFGVDELAAMASMSKWRLYRMFKKTFGESPIVYQQHVRIEAAKTLLHSTDLRCKEVAERCGYDNVPYFNRIFKSTVGMTPSQYRQGKNK